MERLTFKNGDDCWCVRNKHCYEEQSEHYCGPAIDLLAAYEDTELTPEICANYKKFEDEAISKGVTFNRIVELMEAEKDGRLVVLPCKVGDTVYDTRQDIDSRRKNVVVPLSVSGFDVTLCVWETWYGPFPKLKDFGKTVFLNREDAEAALKELQEVTDEE